MSERVMLKMVGAEKVHKDRKKLNLVLLFAGIIGSILVLFITTPIIALFVSVGPSGILLALSDSTAVDAILLSMYAALWATIISLIFGLPLAYFMARTSFPGKAILESLIDLPIVVPHTVAGIALLMVFGLNGFIGAPLNELGLRMADSMPGIVMGMMFVSAPFLVNSIREGFEAVDPRLENVARGLGASRMKAITTVTLPMAKRSVLSGAVMTWARAISEFGAIVMIAYFPMIAPTLIYTNFLQSGLDNTTPIAALLLVVVVVIFVALRTISRKWKVYDD